MLGLELLSGGRDGLLVPPRPPCNPPPNVRPVPLMAGGGGATVMK